MSVPFRLLAAAKPTVPSALLVAIASSTAVFTATPFFVEWGSIVGGAPVIAIVSPPPPAAASIF